jgi:hypothetical protein
MFVINRFDQTTIVGVDSLAAWMNKYIPKAPIKIFGIHMAMRGGIFPLPPNDSAIIIRI